jgi:hypothetical protein
MRPVERLERYISQAAIDDLKRMPFECDILVTDFTILTKIDLRKRAETHGLLFLLATTKLVS